MIEKTTKKPINLLKIQPLSKIDRHFCAGIEKVMSILRKDYYDFDSQTKSKIIINKRHCWNFIPINYCTTTLYQVYRAIYNLSPNTHSLNFLDVGCGIGNILVTAKALGYYVKGLEFQENLINNKMSSHLDIENIDAFLYTKYDRSDIIYLYMPIQDPKEMAKLLQIITDQISIGKVIIFFPASNVKMPKELEEIGYHIWEKQ